ncbi:MAG: hypothetical protein QOJ19_5004 [Acidimicrobiia bacterium]|jgi:pimeloyl-ACP methyl ester carboxylesterase|nr:hypothetical protein [Acidimicrobiia bacterium]
MRLVSSEELAGRCAADGEFGRAARYWTGGLRLEIGEAVLTIRLQDGVVSVGDPAATDRSGVITLAGPRDLWQKLLAPMPPRFFNDVSPALAHGLRRSSDPLLWWQYTPAVQRAVELLREAPRPDDSQTQPSSAAPPATRPARGRFDAAVGRYVHLDLDGHDHRVYFEEAGDGIPVLLQHTAGAHGAQWRHLMERAEITDHFRLIAYDLPFHGKSVPPSTRKWWAEPYRLTGDFLRQVPLALSTALGLERPVFMGCSVGGLLALDLALHHPDAFRAVVSLEGALKVEGNLDALVGFWHPQVGNESKARMMEGLTAPSSPEAYRKETSQTYAAGWPPAFLGDLWYYLVDYDLRGRAHEIDTSRVAVHILTGEYDYSATLEHGRAAHEAIKGSTFTPMYGVGHFPMSENPDALMAYLLPILDQIRTSHETPSVA